MKNENEMLRNSSEMLILLKKTHRRFDFIGHKHADLQFIDLLRQLIHYREKEKEECLFFFRTRLEDFFPNLIAYTSPLNLSFAGSVYVCVLLAIYSVVIIYRHSRPPPTLFY